MITLISENVRITGHKSPYRPFLSLNEKVKKQDRPLLTHEILDDLLEDEITGDAELSTILDDNYKRHGMSESEYRKLVKSAAVDEITRWLRERGWVE